MVERDENGKIKKGSILNPNGRPALPAELKEACRLASPDAIDILLEIMQDVEVRPDARIKAAEILLSRGYGTPTQSVEVSGVDGQPLTPSIVKVVFDDRAPSEVIEK